MHRIFISHCNDDKAFVNAELLPSLRSQGVEPWCDSSDIRTGDDWERKIREGLDSCDWFLVVLTAKSVASEWVRSEVHWAMRHRKGRIVPLLLDTCDPIELHLKLPQIQVVDFRGDREAGWNDLQQLWHEFGNANDTGTRPAARVSFDPRMHRLKVDAEQMAEMAEHEKDIAIVESIGDPPSEYLVKYSLKGVIGIDEHDRPRFLHEHFLRIVLNDDYPMNVPYMCFQSPMFHPNIYEAGNVCIGWFNLPLWLPDVCIHIARMIDYQVYSASIPPYPANQRAYEWAIRDASLFPLTRWVPRAPREQPGVTRSDTTRSVSDHLQQNRSPRIRLTPKKTEITFNVHETRTGVVHEIVAPLDISADALIQELLIALNISAVYSNGAPVPYRLDRKSDGRSLDPTKSLRDNGVEDNDDFYMVAPVMAG